MKVLSELLAMRNGELLEYVKSVSTDTIAADLLKMRWEEFWEKDAVTLEEQRWCIKKQDEEIDRLEAKIEHIRAGNGDTEKDVLRRDNEQLKSRVSYLEQEVRRLIRMLPKPIALRDSVQVVPAFAVYPTRPTEIARMVRVLSK